MGRVCDLSGRQSNAVTKNWRSRCSASWSTRSRSRSLPPPRSVRSWDRRVGRCQYFHRGRVPIWRLADLYSSMRMSMMCYHYTSTSSLILRMLEATTIIVTTWYGERKADGPYTFSWSKHNSAPVRGGARREVNQPSALSRHLSFVLSRCYDTS